MDRAKERERETDKMQDQQRAPPWSGGRTQPFSARCQFGSTTPPWTTFTHKYTRTPMWTALPHVDERQLLFQGDLTLVPNEERERESQNKSEGGTLLFTSPAHPFHPMISKLRCALCPLPGERFPSQPQMKKAGILSCLSPPASCWKGRGRFRVFGEVRTVPSGHALQSSPIQTQGFKSYFPFALWNVEALLAGN